MSSLHPPNFPRRARKALCTYSLTKHDDGTFKLITASRLPSQPSPHPIPIVPVAPTTSIPIAPVPPRTSNVFRTASRYQPYPSIPRGPPANRYLFRQTIQQAAAADKSLAQTVAAYNEYDQRVATEQRISQRGEPARKSARVLAKTDVPATINTQNLDVEEEDSRPKKRARTTHKLAQPTSARATPPQTTQGASAVITSSASSFNSSYKTELIAKKPRKRPEPKVNPRPTERLITRGLAKSSSATQSRSGSGDDVEVIENTTDAAAEVPKESTGQKRKRKDAMNVTEESVPSHFTTPEVRCSPLPVPSSVRGQSSSSDTLVDVPATASLAVKNEFVAKTLSEESPAPALPSDATLSSSDDHPSEDNSPTSTQLVSLSSMSPEIPGEKSSSKRQHPELDEDQQVPAPRRSTRVVKRRKLE